MASLQEFLELSELLTGQKSLDAAVGDDYRRRLESAPGSALGELLVAYGKVATTKDPLGGLVALMTGDAAGQRLRAAAQQIVRIWYLSEFADLAGGVAGAGHFLDSALYSVIEAHPPSYSDRPYGYWAREPH